jgi:hypothetical protein
MLQEGLAEDYKLNNDEHGTHLKFYDCRYNSATYTVFICIMKQTNALLIGSLLYCSLFIAPTCFNANASSSGSSYSLPAK